jgi:NADH-quinone oxidoreductase subunit L
MLFGEFFKDSIIVNEHLHPAMEELAHEFHGAVALGLHSFTSLPFILAAAGVVTAFVFYMVAPSIPATLARVLAPLIKVMENKYYFDWFNEKVLAAGARLVGRGLWKGGDEAIIDGIAINGSAKVVDMISSVVRLGQTGYIYHYALVMLVGVVALMTWFVLLHA